MNSTASTPHYLNANFKLSNCVYLHTIVENF